eukprot:121107-Hanusia_phi.AAC.2
MAMMISEEGREGELRVEQGKLFEGLSSNFFVLKRDQEGNPTLITASEPNFSVYYFHLNLAGGDGVLLGTVRGLALKLCEGLGIKVVEEAPSLQVSSRRGRRGPDGRRQDVAESEEVFISSTSRWVLPVGEVRAEKSESPAERLAGHPPGPDCPATSLHLLDQQGETQTRVQLG